MFTKEHKFKETVVVYNDDTVMVECWWGKMKKWCVTMKEWNFTKSFHHEDVAEEYAKLAVDYTNQYRKPAVWYKTLKRLKYAAVIERHGLVLSYDEDTKAFTCEEEVGYEIAYRNAQGEGLACDIKSGGDIPKDARTITYEDEAWEWFVETNKLPTLSERAVVSKLLEVTGGKLLPIKDDNKSNLIVLVDMEDKKQMLSHWRLELTNEKEKIANAQLAFIPGVGFSLTKFGVGVLTKELEKVVTHLKNGDRIDQYVEVNDDLVLKLNPYATRHDYKGGMVKITYQMDEMVELLDDVWLDRGVYHLVKEDKYVSKPINLIV